MKKLTCLLLALALFLTACGTNTQNLTEKVPPVTVSCANPEDHNPEVMDFVVNLFRTSQEDEENTLISPLSVLYALTMTANGADGETLQQMEQVLGGDAEEIGTWLAAYTNSLGEELHIANSIWYKDTQTFTVSDDFLSMTRGWFDASVFKAPFDESTCREINAWVEKNTDGQIKDILDEIPETVVMYLVNALAFEAKWQEIYKDSQIRDDWFTREDGTQQRVNMMYSTESRYLRDEYATGVMKYYENRDYAFVALLPDEGMTLEEYLDTLTGEGLQEMLENAENTVVQTAIPQFTLDYDVEMSEILKAMGMPLAFDESRADFSRMGTPEEGTLFISRVLHKTHIQVDAQGTKAGAATVVEMDNESAAFAEDPTEVILDRPFVYMILDCKTNLPIFLGTFRDAAGQIEESAPKEPPELQVTWPDGEVEIGYASASWEQRGNTFIACGLHPQDEVGSREKYEICDEWVNLYFDVLPDEFTVRCWPYGENMDAQPVVAVMDGMCLQLLPGSYVYEVSAKWNGGGEASYQIYMVH